MFKETISEIIWDIKYRYRYHDKIIDKNIQNTWRRIAKAIAKVEISSLQKEWEKKFYRILENFCFLPGGRIIAGSGTKHHVTLFNCFVMPIKEDSLTGIFEAIKEGAITLQQGGGVGYDFSTLRPQGSRVLKTDAEASGPVSFMRIWNAMCATMLSTGARRGAMMGILRCDHPDIEQFISAKSNPQELRHFNVSVLVTDEFMQAVKENRDWELVFPLTKKEKNKGNIVYRHWSASSEKMPCRVIKVVKAQALWQRIMQSAYEYAEPGVLFEDTINRTNTLSYCEWISATNPCGEIPLPNYGACNLGAINLTQFVLNPFTSSASIDWEKLIATTQIATRFLDNVIDISRYPLKQQKAEALATRRIGLGITGLADLFVLMNLKYGSSASLTLANQLMKTICETTWYTSIDLAKEKGSFPYFDKEKYLQGYFVRSLSKEIQDKIRECGMRNSHHNTIAPTGTISLLANNVSNGLEPIFSSAFNRTVRLVDGTLQKFSVKSYALRLWEENHPVGSLPPSWIDTQSLKPEDHLNIQRAIQPYVDNAISKTINIPREFPFSELSSVYLQAFEYGLKGCTVFRPNPITGSVLEDNCCRV